MLTGLMENILFWGLNILEIGLFYRVLCICWIAWEERNGLERGVFVVVTLIGATLSVLGKDNSLFSIECFLIQVLFICLSLCVIPKKEKAIGFTIVIVYFTVTALLKFMLSFLIINTMQNNSLVVLEALACSDALVWQLSTKMKKEEDRLRETVEEYTESLLLAAFQGLIILGIYYMISEEAVKGNLAGSTSAAIVLGMIVGIIFVVIQIFLWEEKIENELAFAADREKMLEKNYKQLSQLMQENRENVHDMKHHIHILKTLSSDNETESIRQYLNEIGESVFKGDQIIWTGSKILNAILNQKREEAEINGIRVEVNVEQEFSLPLNDRETCVVFCNLLDNAIEANAAVQENEKWITVSLQKQGEMAFVVIENSIATKPNIKNGLPVSSKKDEKVHGLGLKSVRRNVKPHGGELQFEIEEKIFRVYLSFFLYSH